MEVLSSNDDNDKNGVIEGSETIEPVVSHNEALVLLHKLIYVDGISLQDIDILFLHHEKIEKFKVNDPSKKHRAQLGIFSNKLKWLSFFLDQK